MYGVDLAANKKRFAVGMNCNGQVAATPGATHPVEI
jgi:hypothetical protein